MNRNRAIAGWMLCAWVLWSHSPGGATQTSGGIVLTGASYQFVSAYSSKGECEAAKARLKLPQALQTQSS